MKMLCAIALFLVAEALLLGAFANAIFAGPRRKTWRRIGIALVCILAVFWLSGCGLIEKPHVMVKSESVEVPKYLREPLPAKLVQPCEYAKPDPACWREGHREFCNKQLLQIIDGLDKVLSDCSDDKAALRALDAGKT